jgi:hypothetical protein
LSGRVAKSDGERVVQGYRTILELLLAAALDPSTIIDNRAHTILANLCGMWGSRAGVIAQLRAGRQELWAHPERVIESERARRGRIDILAGILEYYVRELPKLIWPRRQVFSRVPLLSLKHQQVLWQPRRMWKRGFRLARGDPDPLTAPPAPWSGKPGGQAENTNSWDPQPHEFNSASEFFPLEFFRGGELRPRRRLPAARGPPCPLQKEKPPPAHAGRGRVALISIRRRTKHDPVNIAVFTRQSTPSLSASPDRGGLSDAQPFLHGRRRHRNPRPRA